MKGKSIKPTVSQTDWNRLQNMTDEDIDTSDIPEIDENFLGFMKLVVPYNEQVLSLIDQDVLEWFQTHEPEYQHQINTVLRNYIQQVGATTERGI